MPEAAIHKHSHLGSREDEVGLPPDARDWPTMDEEPHAAPMEDRTQLHFALCVVPRLC
jgi:hypothetical protein